MTRGEEWCAEIKDQFALNPAERIIAEEIGKVLDVLAEPGLSTAEARQQRALLSRLLYQLELPQEDGQGERKGVHSHRASRAAKVRWAHEARN